MLAVPSKNVLISLPWNYFQLQKLPATEFLRCLQVVSRRCINGFGALSPSVANFSQIPITGTYIVWKRGYETRNMLKPIVFLQCVTVLNFCTAPFLTILNHFYSFTLCFVIKLCPHINSKWFKISSNFEWKRVYSYYAKRMQLKCLQLLWLWRFRFEQFNRDKRLCKVLHTK